MHCIFIPIFGYIFLLNIKIFFYKYLRIPVDTLQEILILTKVYYLMLH